MEARNLSSEGWNVVIGPVGVKLDLIHVDVRGSLESHKRLIGLLCLLCEDILP